MHGGSRRRGDTVIGRVGDESSHRVCASMSSPIPARARARLFFGPMKFNGNNVMKNTVRLQPRTACWKPRAGI